MIWLVDPVNNRLTPQFQHPARGRTKIRAARDYEYFSRTRPLALLAAGSFCSAVRDRSTRPCNAGSDDIGGMPRNRVDLRNSPRLPSLRSAWHAGPFSVSAPIDLPADTCTPCQRGPDRLEDWSIQRRSESGPIGISTGDYQTDRVMSARHRLPVRRHPTPT